MLQQPRSCCMSGCGFSRLPRTAGDQNAQWTRFRYFPRDPLTCASWIKVSGNPTLLNHSISKLSRTYQICDSHFQPKDGAGLRYLKKGSIPTKLSHTNLLSDDLLLPFLQRNGVDPNILGDSCINLPVAAAVTSGAEVFPCQGKLEHLKESICALERV